MTGLAARESERPTAPVAPGKGGERVAPTLVLSAVVLLAAWMGYESGGYFVSGWAPGALLLAALLLVAAVGGVLREAGSRWTVLAVGLFAAYTVLIPFRVIDVTTPPLPPPPPPTRSIR